MLTICKFGMNVRYVTVPPAVDKDAIGIVVSFGPENEVKVRWYKGFQCIGEWWCSLYDLEEVGITNEYFKLLEENKKLKQELEAMKADIQVT